MKLKIIVTLLAISLSLALARNLEKVDDNELVELIKGEDNVVVLFTKNNCDKCEELETAVENLEDDFKETLGAVVVKAHNSPMVGIYDPSKEPSLLYFRRGIPLLYHGPVNEDEILLAFSENRDPIVKELSDSNFEHLTQAATGATTGDWFVFFYSSDCVICQRLYAVWESVGAALKRRLNVARVNRSQSGISTAKRFNVQESPEFLLIRQGKVYRYRSKDYTPASFIDFAQNIHTKNLKPEAVPPVPNPMNDFITENLKIFAENSQLLTIGAFGLVLIALIGVCCKLFSSKKEKTSKKAK